MMKVSRDKGLKCERKVVRSLYTLSASVNLAVAYERVLIVNLRFIEEVKKARWVRITDARYSQLSPLS